MHSIVHFSSIEEKWTMKNHPRDEDFLVRGWLGGLKSQDRLLGQCQNLHRPTEAAGTEFCYSGFRLKKFMDSRPSCGCFQVSISNSPQLFVVFCLARLFQD